MTDLTTFGVEVDEPEDNDETSSGGNSYDAGRDYRMPRCRGITTDGVRCRSPCSDLETELCHTHEMAHDPVTIDDHPVRLIEATARIRFEDLDERDVNAGLIRTAVHNLVGLEDEPLTVSEDGLWLPRKYAEAEKQLIIRTPWGTTNSVTGPRDRVYSTVGPDDWDVSEDRPESARNDECLEGENAPLVGLKLENEEQRWLPVELVDGGDDE